MIPVYAKNQRTPFQTYWFRRSVAFAALVIAIFARSGPVSAQALIVEFSDNHAAYQRLPDFLRSFAVLKAEFLARHPGAPVVVIANGDYAGLSEWSELDRGWFGTHMLTALTKDAHVLFVLGNHDGFDLGPMGQGNKLVHQQLAFMKRGGVHVLGSNFNYTKETRPNTETHFDVDTPAGRRTRFLGYGLEETKSKASYDDDAPEKIFEGEVKDTLATLREDMAAAIKARVHDVVYFQHDSFPRVSFRINRYRSESIGGPPIRVAFAGHDHSVFIGDVKGTMVVDSGSNFDFSVVELAVDGKVWRHEHHDAASQAELALRATKLEPTERLALTAEKWLRAPAQQMLNEIGPTTGFFETKQDLKAGRSELGTLLAETFRAWGEDFQKSLDKTLPVLAFYNSSSYRRDEPIPRGMLTYGIFKSFYPMPGHATMFRATGREIQNLYRALRVDRESQQDSAYSPQMSDNLDEAAHKVLLFHGRPLHPDHQYRLVLDSWLSRAGTREPVLTEFIATHPPEAKMRTIDLFVKYGAEPFRVSRAITCKQAWAVGEN